MRLIYEKTIVKDILKYLNSLPGCFAKKRRAGPDRKGEPDITGCLNGRRLEIEVKAPGGQPTKLQLEKLKLWKSYGAFTMLAYSVDEVKAEIESVEARKAA